MIKIDNFLSNTEYEKVWKEFHIFKWEMDQVGTTEEDQTFQRQFWYKELLESEYIHNLFKLKVEHLLNARVVTDRLYGNGQAHGQCAQIHQDQYTDTPGNYKSLVYYLHRNWIPQYGGHLIFVDGDKVTNSIFPDTNSCVLFDSKLFHMALEPSVYCTRQRVSIAYKFKVEE
jgi:Rps23 Pro-64 3,4-dihydroxylase Tpa1-like proline 4-hydroxylase